MKRRAFLLAMTAATLVPSAFAQGKATKIGIIGYGSGILLSAVFDLPTGAVVVFTLAVCAVITGRMLPRSR